MGSLTVCAASRADERRRAVRDFLAAGPATLVARSRGPLDDIVFEETLARGHTFGLRRTTLRGLAMDIALADLVSKRALPLTRLGKDALVAAAIGEVLPSVRTTALASAMRTPGFARALSRTMSELGGFIDPEPMLAAVDELGSTEVPLRSLHDAYQALLSLRGYASDLAIFASARGVLARGEAPAVAAIDRIVVVDPLHLTPAEALFIATLAQVGDVLLTLPVVDARGRGLLRDAARDLSVQFGESASEADSEHPAPSTFEGASDYLEAVEIARRITEEAKRGTTLDRIAIVSGSRELFTSNLVLALARAKLPAHFDEGVKRPQAAGRAFLALLQYKLAGGTPALLFDYLSIGKVGRARAHAPGGFPAELELAGADEAAEGNEDEGDELAASSAAEDESAKRIRPRRWIAVLGEVGLVEPEGTTLEAALSQRLVAYRKATTDRLASTTDETVRGMLDEALVDLTSIEEHLLPMLALLDALPSRGTYRSLCAGLETLRVNSLTESDSIARVLDELAPLHGFEHEVELRAIVELVAPRLAWLSGRDRGARYGRIFVTTPDGMAGRTFDVVFVAGLADGVFPTAGREDPILPDAARMLLRERGVPLVTNSERYQVERTRFVTALGAAPRAVCSYPRFDVASGRSRVPGAFFIDAHRSGARSRNRSSLLWPGASERAETIDATDYALAELRGLRRTPRPGAARFLLAGSPFLHRALTTRYQRNNRPRYTECDGLLVPRGEPALQGLSLKDRPYSPSTLELYASCPYKFYLRAIANLRADDSDETDRDVLEPRVFGDLYHRCQALLTHEILALGLDLQRDRELIFERCRAIAEAEAEVLRRDVLPRVPRVFAREVERLERELTAYVALLMAEKEGWRPAFADLSFGLPTAEHLDPRSSETDVTLRNGLRVHGAIDAIEVDLVGNYRVTDFKTGRASRWEAKGVLQIQGGEMLQPALYALAAEAVLARTGDDARVVLSRLYYSRDKSPRRTLDVAVEEGTRRAALYALEAVEEAISEGSFMAFPQQEACKKCTYLLVCGPSETIRLTSKSETDLPRTLEKLNRLRKLP